MTSETNTAIGAKVGVTSSSVGRWATGSLPDPEKAATFARKYGRPVLEAFVAAGYLSPEEAAQRPAQRHPITAYDDDELVREVARRIQEGGHHAGTNAQKSSGGYVPQVTTDQEIAVTYADRGTESRPDASPTSPQSARGKRR